jgi:hypothetical protein
MQELGLEPHTATVFKSMNEHLPIVYSLQQQQQSSILVTSKLE